ncbi:adenylyltransferase/cytidyltransferase family protein [Rhodospirillaceae bacterium KN72]|uniref:Adenylyltransferase/cytidyltransferase family protein n=1 Tax=Pacificispira spongiicola TaxID=2729598 RepID=A0A7Y0E5D4_9PROT|nr:PfkB family carbohydrate kinase [Pacificispira spongiicola]NMM46711.1 adenylyltransferase/cytidyltransferase family protein [Pacificispira spongiicola]
MLVSLTERYGHKIKTPQELREILGPYPREKKVIMCHGVFDVVHPGHVRHMLYAKSKADILLVSITADRHIEKGTYRPHVPQDLRAANLAAFEMVDFVVIDQNAAPLENIRFIQPDFFAKGYEYNATTAMNPKTIEETEVISEYGGEMIFTPGDIVYSSSNLIEMASPQIRDEKTLTVMERHGVTFDKLRETLTQITGKKVHIVGDTIIDSLTNCAMIGGQTKTPTMSVLFENRTNFVGGAGIVAKHLRAAGADVHFSTVLGDDTLGRFALDDLQKAGVIVHPQIDKTRPTVNKDAFVVGGYRLLKVDTLDNRSISDNILSQIADAVKSINTDALIFSDFRHGIFNRRTIPRLIDSVPSNCFKVADSQVASRWGNIIEFKGFDLITPNEREARFALADQDSPLRSLASDLYDAAGCETLILKIGQRGILTYISGDHKSLDSFFSIDSFADSVVDAVGAGDGLLAYSTLAMLVNKQPVIAAILGSMAAACVCERDGNVPVTPQDVLAKIDAVERRIQYQ